MGGGKGGREGGRGMRRGGRGGAVPFFFRAEARNRAGVWSFPAMKSALYKATVQHTINFTGLDDLVWAEVWTKQFKLMNSHARRLNSNSRTAVGEGLGWGGVWRGGGCGGVRQGRRWGAVGEAWGWVGVGWAGLGWAGLGWAALGRAGLG